MAVQALLQFDGADGSTTFTDATGNQVWTAGGTGTCELDTAEFHSGTASLITGAGAYLGATLLNPLTTFTVEAWFYIPAGAATSAVILELNLSGSSIEYLQIQWNQSNDHVSAYNQYYGSTVMCYGYDRSDQHGQDAWVHVVIQRDANGYVYGYVNGCRSNLTFINHPNLQSTVDAVYIGNKNPSTTAGTDLACQVDSLRITDEVLYPRLGYDNVPAAPLTLSPVTIEQAFLNREPDLVLPRDYYQVYPGINGQNLRDSVTIIEQEPEDTTQITGNGIQIWG